MPHIAQLNPLTASASDSTPNRPSTTDTRSVILSLEQLQAWIDQLSARLLSLKSVQVNSDRLGLMMLELHRMQYTERLRRRADAWIIYGDWKYRGTSPTIEIGDFYPTEEQVQSVADRQQPRYALVEAAELARMRDTFLRQGFEEGRAYEAARAQERQGIAELEAAWRSNHD